jgi:hypothetical protein
MLHIRVISPPAVTTIPAAADIAVSVAFGSWSEAEGSALQLLLNVGVLIVVGALALRGQRLIWQRWARSPRRSAQPGGLSPARGRKAG